MSFIRPEFAKIKILSPYEFEKQEEEEAVLKKMSFTKVSSDNDFVSTSSPSHYLFGGLDKNIYSKYIGRVKLKQSEKEEKCIVYSKEEAHIFKTAKVYKKIKTFNPEEKCYKDGIKKIEECLRDQFRVCDPNLYLGTTEGDEFNNYTFFHQLTPVLTDQLEKKTKDFMEIPNHNKFEYRDMVKEINIYKDLCQQLPKIVKFPLFYVNMEQVKTELIRRVEDILQMLYVNLEQQIIQRGEAINQEHYKATSILEKRLSTLEEVDEMDKYKNTLLLERYGMNDRIEDWVESLMLLINLDYIISERTQIMATLIYNWGPRLDALLDEANRKHFDQKIYIEDKIAREEKARKKLEELEKQKSEEK